MIRVKKTYLFSDIKFCAYMREVKKQYMRHCIAEGIPRKQVYYYDRVTTFSRKNGIAVGREYQFFPLNKLKKPFTYI
jgi:hypothetical protein